MIKLNLLASNLIKKEERKEIFILAILLAGLIVFSGTVSYGLKFYSLKKQEDKIEQVNRELGKYESIIRQLDALKSTKAVLETKKNLINTLMATGLTYPNFMEKLMKLLPDNVWFKAVNTKTIDDSNMSIDITAEALDNFSIADFMSALMADSSISNIELGTINTISAERGQSYTFKISFNYGKETKK